MEIPEWLDIKLTKHQKLRLIPFFSTWLMYYVLYMPVFGYPPENLGSVFFKVLPIISLAFYVISTHIQLNRMPKTIEELIPEDDQARNFVFALLCSAVGDACLVWRELLFIPGLLAFAAGHVFYCIGLNGGSSQSQSRMKGLIVLLAIDVFLFIQGGISSYILTLLVAVYNVLIFAVVWRAIARYEAEGTKQATYGCIGAMLFTVSDFLIAVDKWFIGVSLFPSLIMSTYYIAQFCLALSTTKGLEPKSVTNEKAG